MLPVIALVGRPNVGKSTLFNQLTRSRDALVADMPGLTRDRKYGHAELHGHRVILIDTGGITGEEEGIDWEMAKQSRLAMQEADLVVFLCDARDGLTPVDEELAQELRQLNKACLLVVNKIDGLNPDIALPEFFAVGLGEPAAIAAAHGRGVSLLGEAMLAKLNMEPVAIDEEEGEAVEEAVDPNRPVRMAIVGRPNVGKSTLVNRLLGEDRVVVFDHPGTTRDSIYIDMERRGKKYTLIDTAGVRKRGKVFEAVEKFSVVKTLQAIEDADVVVLLMDASENVTEQDLHLLGYIMEAGRAVVIAANKWDGLDTDQRQLIKDEIDRRLGFADFARLHFISALHGTGVGDLFESVHEAFDCANLSVSTSKMTDLLEQAQREFQAPQVNRRRVKMRYAHLGGHNPFRIVIHGTQVARLPIHYQRYLVNFYRRELNLVGAPIKLELKDSENPFKDKKNVLSERQAQRRKRMIRARKKGK